MVKSMAVPGDATIRNEENPAELASGRRGREFDSRRHGRLSDTAGASERETWAVAMLKLGCWLPAMAALLSLGSVPVEAQVRITEFMASNTHTLVDEDGDSSDWIEIQNTTAADVNLLNWALTDSAGNPGKWPFPATNMTPGGFLVVFASGKDRRLPGAPLHANFKLDSAGEYLALFRPDGTAATEIWPAYPAQFPDVSYGLAMQLATAVLVASNAPVLYRIPASAADDADWTQPGFTSAGWEAGTNGLGYETGLPEPDQESFAAKVLATGPVAYWRLNETSGAEAVNSGTGGVSDEGGYNGAILLGEAGPRPPEFATMEANNTAPFFDGVSACVNGPFELVDALPAFTLAGWINPTAAQPNRTGLFGQNDTIEFGFISPGVIQVWTAYGSVTAGYPFPNNQWHYVTATGGNGLLALYFDGRLAGATPASPANFGESEFNFNIGGGGVFDPTGNYFQGLIDEVAVWFRALATNEIAALLATNAGQVDYAPYIATDVRTQMLGSNSTAYVRIPFTVADPGAFGSLKLLVRYDDGFAAFLNGYRIASSNAPTALSWNSAATQPHPDAEAVQWESFDVSAALPYLQPGSNVLAVQGLNIAATNTDFLLQVQLLASSVTASTNLWRFFTLPTPGGPNGTGANDLGPILTAAGHWPGVPQAGGSLTVTAEVAQAFSPLSQVTLHYRVMFNQEVSLSMNDSGAYSQAWPGDGVWTATLPGGIASPGQMIRYYVTATDTAGQVSRWPLHPEPSGWQQYLGTMVADTSVASELPVPWLFIQDPSAADNQTGTQASLFYLNELYDNLIIYVHGQSSVGWPKKGHNLHFPADHRFLYKPGGVRQNKTIFMSNYSDKARMRTTLTYAITALGGGVAFFSFPIRLQLNGAFWGIEDMVEDGDKLFLERVGRDGNGALYKMYNDLSSASGNEKKTRHKEGTQDLTALIASLDESIPLANRILYAYDNLDLPQTAGFFANLAIVSDQDVGHKNYYLYRDSEGTGEWSIFPWDVDLSWGRNWVDDFSGSNYFNDVMFQTNTLSFYPGAPIQSKPSNRLFDLFFGAADFRQMYLRRLRTLMDTVLEPPGTPTNALVIEPLIRQYENALNPAAIAPSDAALDNAAWGPSWGDVSLSRFPNDAERLIAVHLAGRRTFLFTSPQATLNGDPIPPSQPASTIVSFGSWDFQPVSGNPAEQYIELRNTNSYAVDVSDWRLTGGVTFSMRPGTVIPAGKSLYLAANVNAFRARANGPSGRQGLFVQGPFAGLLSAQGNTPLILEDDRGAAVSRNQFAGNPSCVPFVAGNLAVLRVGDGSESLSSHGNSVFLDQFTTNGMLVSSIPIANNAANALILSGSASSEGALARTPDGRMLVFAGYQVPLTNAALLGSSLADAEAALAPRALGIVDLDGTFALAAVTTNLYSQNNIRSAASDGAGNYWGAGANSGTCYLGGGAPATIQASIGDTAVIQDLGGNLFFSASKTAPGIWQLPGTPIQAASPAPILSEQPGANPLAFAFNPTFTTAYLADDTLTGQGGVRRWDLTAGVWSFTYAFTGLTNTGARGLAVDFSGPHPMIYATSAQAAANQLVSITDTGPASAVIPLVTAGVNQVFRGLAFAPSGSSAPCFLAGAPSVGGFKLIWTALINRNYTLQYTDNLAGANWLTLTNVTAAAPVLTATDPGAAAGPNRFYRVILNP